MISRQTLSRFLPFARCLLVSIAVATSGVVTAHAADAKQPELKRTLTDKTSEALGKLDPVLKASNWDTALVMLKGIVADAPPRSYDKALGSFILAQVYLQHAQTKGLAKSATEADYAASLPLFEYALNSGYYEDKRSDLLFTLAQLYLQAGNAAKAEELARQWLAAVPKPTQEGIIFIATLTYQRAEKDPKNVDKKAMAEVVTLADRALRLYVKPMENVYLLKAVALQNLERLQEASEVLEQMVEKWPKNSQYWSQLYAVYANSNQPLRAAITIERAQQLGLMSSPKENLTLATLYYNMEYLDKAIELLKNGLRDGKIEAEKNTYELLAFALQRQFRELDAVEVYKEASKHFKTGQFDATIAQLYYQMNQYPQAYKYAEIALDKGELDNEFATLMFATYVGYELQDYQKALKYVTKAMSLAKTDKDKKDAEGLKKAVEIQIQNIENAKAAAAATADAR